jgi:hypothetical protein
MYGIKKAPIIVIAVTRRVVPPIELPLMEDSETVVRDLM